MVPTLQTQRLYLRRLDLSDAAAVQELFSHWEIVRFLNAKIPWPYPADGAISFIRDHALPAMDSKIEWHWSIRLKTWPKRLIGVISLMDDPVDNRAYWIGLPWQCKGYVSEACNMVTDFWFEKLDRAILRASNASENFPSRCIALRDEMRHSGKSTRSYVCGRLPTDLWEITREEWRARRSRAQVTQG